MYIYTLDFFFLTLFFSDNKIRHHEQLPNLQMYISSQPMASAIMW